MTKKKSVWAEAEATARGTLVPFIGVKKCIQYLTKDRLHPKCVPNDQPSAHSAVVGHNYTERS